MSKYIDCIIFYDDNQMYDIRLHTLKDYVDFFVVVEATKSHTGTPKKLNFDHDLFRKYKDKIIYIVQGDEDIEKNKYTHIEDSKPVDQNWKREYSQRNFIYEGIKQFDDDDFILVSDTDEIPNPKELIKIKSKRKLYYFFQQKNYMYKFNYLTHNEWHGTRMCLKKFLKSPNWLHKKLFPKKKFLYNFRKNIKIIKDGGWHFSYCRTPNNIIEKLNNFAHQEFNKDILKDEKYLAKKIELGEDFLGIFRKNEDNLLFKKVNIDETYPEYIRNNIYKFKDFII